MPTRADLLPGTLDLLILKAVSLGPLHGYAVLLRIEQMTGGALVVEQGALYPALFRLEHRGLLDTEWGVSDNNRRAKFYRLTAAGRKQLKTETRRLESAGDGDAGRARHASRRGLDHVGPPAFAVRADRSAGRASSTTCPTSWTSI